MAAQELDNTAIKARLGKYVAEIVFIELQKIATHKDTPTLALGTGTTVAAFWKEFLSLLPDQLKLQVICTSIQSRQLVLEAHNPNIILADFGQLSYKSDILVDGFDLIDVDRNMVKGGGAAHLMEKILAWNSKNRIYMGGYDKKVECLAQQHIPLPVEVVRDAASFAQVEILRRCALKSSIRNSSLGRCGPVLTDNSNFVLDVELYMLDRQTIDEIDYKICQCPGVVATGYFPSSLVDRVVLCDKDGKIIDTICGSS